MPSRPVLLVWNLETRPCLALILTKISKQLHPCCISHCCTPPLLFQRPIYWVLLFCHPRWILLLWTPDIVPVEAPNRQPGSTNLPAASNSSFVQQLISSFAVCWIDFSSFQSLEAVPQKTVYQRRAIRRRERIDDHHDDTSLRPSGTERKGCFAPVNDSLYVSKFELPPPCSIQTINSLLLLLIDSCASLSYHTYGLWKIGTTSSQRRKKGRRTTTTSDENDVSRHCPPPAPPPPRTPRATTHYFFPLSAFRSVGRRRTLILPYHMLAAALSPLAAHTIHTLHIVS